MSSVPNRATLRAKLEGEDAAKSIGVVMARQLRSMAETSCSGSKKNERASF
ncbi:MAG: hypothetical protein Q8P67_15215 [archaeon]|nr:hypothetical protein [archaeon]